ncbi:hypothetical protein CAC42_7402 [Sphaceloma murrayae]|uniref:Uncharacterized protein n=1 Tax=Sphaceloma murrayae TaxID=2082308 RepID=A0A2K1QWX2_9PEZI|nr:hypothetical protein CAC42_7402 [Sphaceloma murrayae]
MAIISGGTAQFLLFTVLPFLWPRLSAFYRSIRSSDPSSIRPLSHGASISLNILLLTALAFLLSTLPLFSPSNIFAATSSRLQAPTGVLFTRLSNLHTLSPTEQRLRVVFEKGGLEARLLYLKFGPDVLQGCTFVDHKAEDAATVLFAYALPAILTPHLIHLGVLGLTTAKGITGADGARWRTAAVVAGLAALLVEVTVVGWYDHQDNSKAKTLGELNFFYWKLRVVRGLVLAAVDALLGWMVWLASTGRAFVQPLSGAEKVEGITREVEGTLVKMRGLGTMRNVVYRNSGMRGAVERYWVHEGEVMRSVVEDREVAQAMTNVLESTNVEQLGREAGEHVDAWMPRFEPMEGQT